MAIQRICNYSGCQNYALDGHFYCKEHYKEPKPFENARRNNESFYNTHQWRTLRKEHLRNNPNCVCCGTNENLTVDHITDPLGNALLFFDENNLQTLCKDCHRIKTAKEIADRKRK